MFNESENIEALILCGRLIQAASTYISCLEAPNETVGLRYAENDLRIFITRALKDTDCEFTNSQLCDVAKLLVYARDGFVPEVHE